MKQLKREKNKYVFIIISDMTVNSYHADLCSGH